MAQRNRGLIFCMFPLRGTSHYETIKRTQKTLDSLLFLNTVECETFRELWNIQGQCL